MARAAIEDALEEIDAEQIRMTNPNATHEEESCFLILGTSHGTRLDEDEAGEAPADTFVRALAQEFRARPLALSIACSSGSDAVLVCAELIRSGRATRCICGALDVITQSKRLAHSALGTISPAGLRSFDAQADGTILGEGAAVLILEPGERV
ncbi:beta-ketoacyl synthase N-terminal-like domain-containing protein [Breoghania sp.]|uniref:beta-ketoacyl synthase N-terminal-like domain-containing protein n=1 Tax=Breoghania sp. TaxID=2065378 RepID=UPI00260D9E07|nr:beta-ketoacyl synthase N-terminal-like domain-containing protein [Breoghania sp.]MDJ0933517.1 beta-ketoacyl synthase N-terminal-like domain-containing protein [Breoghania sp.]